MTEQINEEQKAALLKLRAPFEPNQINLLPKPFKADSAKGNCKDCGGYHGLPAAHLEYVGHAALTARLLDVDPLWTWEPLAVDANGLPAYQDGCLWIRLTVCGVTRLGVGDAQGKTGANAKKELIGDALRNAGMRFGAALELWHKGILYMDQDDIPTEPVEQKKKAPAEKLPMDGARFDKALESVRAGEYTVAKIRKNFAVSDDQETVLADLEKELAK
jgi:hypothetical protein